MAPSDDTSAPTLDGLRVLDLGDRASTAWCGRLMADLVTGRTPLVDPTAFRFNRFSDGSKIELISGF